MIVDRWIFSIFLQYSFLIYVVWLLFHLRIELFHQFLLLYVVYLAMELVQLLVLLYYCDNRKRILVIGAVFPLMPFYDMWMRMVTIWTITEELLTRRSYKDNFVPAHVRNVTWHW